MPHTSPSSATASPAASSPDLPAFGRLCAIHQPNLFPRLATLAKLFAADTWIILDDVQFTRRDYQHRTRLASLQDPQASRWMFLPHPLTRAARRRGHGARSGCRGPERGGQRPRALASSPLFIEERPLIPRSLASL